MDYFSVYKYRYILREKTMMTAPKFDTHFCIVSDQPLPNFLPILAKEFRPQKVVLIVSKKMQEKATFLSEVLKNRCNTNVEIFMLEDESNMIALEEKLLDRVAEYPIDKVALNLTGGTKLMAISAFNLFKNLGYSSFYFNADSNEVILFEKGNVAAPPRFLLTPPKIDLADFLSLHGFTTNQGVSRESPISYPDIGQKLIQSRTLSDELLSLYGAGANTDLDLSANVRVTATNLQNFDQLVALFDQYDLLDFKDKKQIIFPNLESKQYVMGGWFEDYIFTTLKTIPGIQDIAINLQIQSAQQNTHQPNEIDIAILYKNTLHIIEYKTAKYKTNTSAKDEVFDENATNALYKLESLKKLGGLRTKLMFISLRELNRFARDRAKGSGISLIEGRESLKGLKTLVQKWLDAQTV